MEYVRTYSTYTPHTQTHTTPFYSPFCHYSRLTKKKKEKTQYATNTIIFPPDTKRKHCDSSLTFDHDYIFSGKRTDINNKK